MPQEYVGKGCNVWKGRGCRALMATRETAFAQRDRLEPNPCGTYRRAERIIWQGGWIMYCDGCGTPLTSGGQFSTKCGKPIVPSAASSPPALGHAGAPAAA